MDRKKLLFISSYFPNPCGPNIATYNRQQLVALSELYDVNAVVPIPWTVRVRNRTIPANAMVENIRVQYPTYLYPPLILRKTYGACFFNSIRKSVAELTNTTTFDLIYTSWLYPDAWAAAKVARMLGLPLFVSVLGTDVNRLQADRFLCKKALEVSMYASKIKCVSRQLMEKLRSIGCEDEKLTVLQNGVNESIFYPVPKAEARNELDIPVDDKIILFVGNLKKEKGLGELSQAFTHLIHDYHVDNCRLIVIGGGKFRKIFERMLKENNVFDKADILGERSLEVISKYMNACDVLCLPSYSEGQPNVVMEALACHTRVVASTVGGIPDLEVGFANILLVPPQNVPDLTKALHEVLTNERDCENWYKLNTWKSNAYRLHELFDNDCP